MPARIHRLPITTQDNEKKGRSGIPRPSLKITAANWSQMEKALGLKALKIAPLVREQIEVATTRYVWLARMENGARPLADANQILEKLKSFASQIKLLRPDLVSIQRCDTDEHAFVRSRIQANFRAPSGRPFDDHLNKFIPDLVAFGDAVTEITEKVTDYQQYGNSWDRWRADLEDALQQAGLPTGASKDSRCRKDSPFVLFFLELQNVLPQCEHLQPYSNSASMAEAISRSRRKRLFRRG